MYTSVIWGENWLCHLLSAKGKRIQPTTTKTRISVRGIQIEQPVCWVSIQLLKGRNCQLDNKYALQACGHKLQDDPLQEITAEGLTQVTWRQLEDWTAFLFYFAGYTCIDHMKVNKNGMHTSCCWDLSAIKNMDVGALNEACLMILLCEGAILGDTRIIMELLTL